MGLTNGTLLSLGIASTCDDVADNSGKKFQYLVTVCVINDDSCKIRAYMSDNSIIDCIIDAEIISSLSTNVSLARVAK